VVAFARTYGTRSYNKVEATTLLWGLNIMISMEVDSLAIEGDSMLVVIVFKGNESINWKIKSIIQDIQALMGRLQNVIVHHSFKVRKQRTKGCPFISYMKHSSFNYLNTMRPSTHHSRLPSEAPLVITLKPLPLPIFPLI
jgi:hypothetical protein